MWSPYATGLVLILLKIYKQDKQKLISRMERRSSVRANQFQHDKGIL